MKIRNLIWGLIGLVVLLAVIAAIFLVGPETNESDNLSTSYNGVEIVPDLTKDAIPPLTNPEYENGLNQLDWLNDDDRVIGIEVNGDARAYPLKIMSYHELVNDTIGGEEVAITYSPLCGSSLLFSRQLNEQPLEFGNTGALYEGCSVMYDTQTNSYWWQVSGQSIRGDYIDQALTILPSTVLSWSEWRSAFPLTRVLSIETGHNRNYLADPFTEYYTVEDVVGFPPSQTDDRLSGKEPVVGITVGEKHKAYAVKDTKDKTIEENFNGQDIKIIGNKAGNSAQVFFVNGTSKKPAPATNAFWFAWFVAHQDTELYQPN